MGSKKERKPKDDKKESKKANGQEQVKMNSGRTMNSGKQEANFTGCEISHPAKFCRLRNFRNPAKFLRCSNFLVFSALLSLWFLICNAEFDSNSSCLDRLNNFGINSLQKLQN